LRSSEALPVIFEGQWSSGETANAVPAAISFEADGLSVKAADGSLLAFWSYGDLLPGAPIGRDSDDVLLRSSKAPRAALFIKGEGAGKLLISRAPRTAQSFQRFKIVSLSMIATAIILIAGVVLFFGRFSVSKAIAALIPDTTADRMGAQSVKIFGPIAPACVDQPGNAALQRILDRLQSSSDYGRPFKLHVIKSGIPNAFALPGRHIVLLSGLVKQAKSPEEVAGVLAHEMGHGLEKDPEVLFVRRTGMQAFLDLLTGQSGTQVPIAAGAFFLQLRYSRDAERSADAHAVEILRNSHIEPKPTGDFFLRDAAKGKETDESKLLSYLSTHPSSNERAQLFLSQPAYAVQPILNEKDWADAQAICGPEGVKKPGEDREGPKKPKPPEKPKPDPLPQLKLPKAPSPV
jgi:Zn-dependent protease with chaperone function